MICKALQTKTAETQEICNNKTYMKIENVVFMGTPEFAVPTLKALAESRFKPILCITQPDRPKGRKRKLQPTPVKIAAQNYDIPIIQPENINTLEVINELSEISPDIIVTAAFGGFLGKHLRLLPAYGCINLHPSLLPRYRGSAPINYALFNKDKFTGNTIFKIVAKMDAGPIIAQSKIEISNDDNYTSLYKKLSEQGAREIVDVLVDIEKNDGVLATPQDHTKATFSSKISKEDLVLDWNNSAQFIYNRIRGLAESPGLTASFREKRVKIIEAEILDSCSDDESGTILEIGKDGIAAATKDNNILLTKLQPAGKKIMTSHAFSLGARIDVKERFENGF